MRKLFWQEYHMRRMVKRGIRSIRVEQRYYNKTTFLLKCIKEIYAIATKEKRKSILSDKVSGDNIYRALIYFDKTYDTLNEAEKREFMEHLLAKVEVYEERQPNGQWLKHIEFMLPIIEHDMKISLDNDEQVESCVLLCRTDTQKSLILRSFSTISYLHQMRKMYWKRS